MNMSIETLANLQQLSQAHMLRSMDDSGLIKLAKHEREYASEAEDYLSRNDQEQLSASQRRVIRRLYNKYILPIMRATERKI